MQWFYLMMLSFVLWLGAKLFRSRDQVYAVAAVATGLISFSWGFVWAPAWAQLLIAGSLFGLYKLYVQRLNRQARVRLAMPPRATRSLQLAYVKAKEVEVPNQQPLSLSR